MILSIDCGSTNLKAALFDKELRPVAQHGVPLNYCRRDAVYVEFDAEALWVSFQRLLRELLSKGGVSLAALTHVTMGSQAQSFCLLDERDKPLIPFISWMDIRAADESRELVNAFGSDFHRHCSFSTPLPSIQIVKMLWVKRHFPDLWARSRRLVSMPGFLFLKLSGLNIIDTNLAAMSGLYSQALDAWWPDSLSRAGVPPSWMPELKPAGTHWTGTISLDGVSADGVGLVPAGNDHTAGALGNGCRPGEVIVTFGTALVAYSRCGVEPGPFHAGGCWGPYPLGGYYELASSAYGCSALDWAREVLLPGRPAAEFDALALTAKPGCGGVRFDPKLARTDSAWTGKGSPADRARAVLEGILFRLRQMLARDIQAPRDRQVCALGGGSKSDIWMRMAADVLGCTVRRGAGDSLLGAAALAAGRAESLERVHDRALAPDPAAAAWYDDLIGRGVES